MRYFGETIKEDCGICSYCISKNKKTRGNTGQREVKQNEESTSEKILTVLKIQDFNSRAIQKLTKLPKDDVIFALQNLLENDTICINATNLYSLKKQRN
jgi:ATP-dependent DNA helicase RecQ